MFDAKLEAELKAQKEQVEHLKVELTMALCGLIILRRFMHNAGLEEGVKTANDLIRDTSRVLDRDPLPLTSPQWETKQP